MANEFTNTTSRPVNVYFSDISSAASHSFAAPFQCKVIKYWAALGSSNSSAATELTLDVGGTAIDSSTLSITASLAAKGKVEKVLSIGEATNFARQGDVITVTGDGGSTKTLAANVTFLLGPA